MMMYSFSRALFRDYKKSNCINKNQQMPVYPVFWSDKKLHEPVFVTIFVKHSFCLLLILMRSNLKTV
ncbi:hypothetical protein D3C86_1211340 [compost metagenome]